MPRLINHTPHRAPMTSMQHERAAPVRWEREHSRAWTWPIAIFAVIMLWTIAGGAFIDWIMP